MANHHPCLALVAPMSRCFAYLLALLLSLPKELSLYPPPAALGSLPPAGIFRAPERGPLLTAAPKVTKRSA